MKREQRAYLLFGCEVVHDIEELANFLRGFAFDHVRYGFASNIAEQRTYPAVRTEKSAKIASLTGVI